MMSRALAASREDVAPTKPLDERIDGTFYGAIERATCGCSTGRCATAG